ncbi:MAG: polysaccharide deacetylase family protein [Nannocystaceae bacterium]
MRPLLVDWATRLLFVSGFTHPRRLPRDHLGVATFHRVLPPDQRSEYPFPGLAVTPEAFEWCLRLLSTHFECGTLGDTMNKWRAQDPARRLDRPLMAITFDDGQLDNYLHAKPVMDALGIHGSFFVPYANVEADEPLWHDRMGMSILKIYRSGAASFAALTEELGLAKVGSPGDEQAAVRQVVVAAKSLPRDQVFRWVGICERRSGGRQRLAWDGLMSFDQLAELSKQGHEIGSHTQSHAILTNCTAPQLDEEVRVSRTKLQARLQLPVESFCYPNGNCDTRSIECVRAAGYHQAVTTSWGSNAPGQSAFALKRRDMTSRALRSNAGRLSAARFAWTLSDIGRRAGS